MKRILTSILILVGLFCSFEQGQCAQNKFFKLKQQKTETQKKGTFSNIYSVAKFVAEYESAANSFNQKAFLDFYADDYINNDGFDKSVIEKNVKKTWECYSGIKYKIRLNGVTFDKDTAIADITEVASGSARTDNQNIADFTSTTQTIYYLKNNGESWVIKGDNTLKENVVLRWGDAKLAKINLDTPSQISAGKEYSSILSIDYPKDVIAIGSINSDIITYPLKPNKEIFRKFSEDGIIERIMKSNTDNLNEYIVATVGFTRPKLDNNKNLDINLSGYACIMQRMNVIPVNKYIEVKDEQIK